MTSGLKEFGDNLGKTIREELAKKHGFEDNGTELVLTTEQAEREYGTPESPPQPWIRRALRDG